MVLASELESLPVPESDQGGTARAGPAKAGILARKRKAFRLSQLAQGGQGSTTGSDDETDYQTGLSVNP